MIDLSYHYIQIRTPVHEFLHILGFLHEFQRTDRDDYVTVMLSNVRAGFTSNFNIKNNINQESRYDISSIMQYTGDVGASYI